jgi:hypothetical protein
MAIERLYRDYTVERKAGGGEGRAVGTYTQVATYRGFLQESGKSEQQLKSSSGGLSTFILFTTISADIKYQDRIVYNGDYYAVSEPPAKDGAAGVGHHKEVFLTRFNTNG